MQDSRILSSFQDLAPAAGMRPLRRMPEPVRASELVFDTCKVGVVLRAVLFVQAVVWVAALFGAQGLWAWTGQMAMLTGAALPATLVWLLGVCALKRPLGALPMPAQWTAGVTLGALAALYGCALLYWMGLVDPAPWLASAASGALLAAVLVAALVWRARARTPASTTARLAELQARIRPHFLFNTINAVLSIVRAQPRQAEAALQDMSDLFRMAMADAQDLVPLRQEIELGRQYIALEQLRMGARLQVEWQVAEVGGALIPPLLLQPLLENAVYHGIEPLPQGGSIRVELWRSGDELRLKVENPCPARDTAPHPGNRMALQNIRERLALLFDVEARYKVDSGKNFYRVEITLPYLKEKAV